MGLIGVKFYLVLFLLGYFVINIVGENFSGVVFVVFWGSVSILFIFWMYIVMMGVDGLIEVIKIVILNVNYIVYRLESYYLVLYKGKYGFIVYECILDLCLLKKLVSIEVQDIVKCLMDYGFYVFIVFWFVVGIIMVEFMESEFKEELDCFCDVMIFICQEIEEIEIGKVDKEDNLLKNVFYIVESLMVDDWKYGYF